MDKIIEGIFAVKKDHKEKLVLVQTLRSHLLKVDAVTGGKIISCSVDKLSDNNDKLTRALSTRILDILFQVYPGRVLTELAQHSHNNAEYSNLCTRLICKAIRAEPSNQEGKIIAEMLANFKHLVFNTTDVDLIIATLSSHKHWFSDPSVWIDVYFYYCGIANNTAPNVETRLILPDQTALVQLLKLIGSRLSEGALTRTQGWILSGITEPSIVQTASQEFLSSLTDAQLSKCLDNLLLLQKQDVSLAHWIVTLLNCLCDRKRYMLVIQFSERYVDLLLQDTCVEGQGAPHSTEKYELLCYFLLLHQHSPCLFHRSFVKLCALESVECVSQTLHSLMLRYPHFWRLYGKHSAAPRYSWSALQEVLAGSRTRFSPAVGFNNRGNTCYFNSLVQALWLGLPFQSDVIFSRVESSILTELRRVFLNLSYSIRSSFSPDTLFHVVRPPWFAFGSQQDSAELLRHLFDLISSGGSSLPEQPNQLLASTAGLMGGRDFGSVESSKYRRYCATPKDLSTASQPSQIINKHFQGVQEVTITCRTCGNSSSKQEPFLFLSLPCGTRGPCTLEQLILQSMATEQLSEDNQYHCETCAGKSDAIRQTTLTSLPNTFIFTLNRFSYDRELKCRSKLLTKVSVPGWVGFSANSDGSHTLLQEGELQYRLYATVVHSGSTTESGHYYTYGLPSTHATDVLSSSLRFDDATVTRVSEDLVNEPQREIETPYLLFYERQDHAPPQADLDLAEVTDILNNNLRYLQHSAAEEPRAATSSPQDRGDDDAPRSIHHVGGCHSNDFASGSNRFIY